MGSKYKPVHIPLKKTLLRPFKVHTGRYVSVILHTNPPLQLEHEHPINMPQLHTPTHWRALIMMHLRVCRTEENC